MRAGCWMLFLFLTLAERQGLSHEAEEASVAVSLRDRAVEVRINVDLTSWISNITGLPQTMEHPVDIEPMLVLAAHNLKQSLLKVGDAKVPLEIVQFPKTDDIAHAHDRGQTGHLRSTIVMRGALSAVSSGVLSMQVPKEMGPIIMSFSQPETAWVAAGAAGVFQLDGARLEKKHSRPIARSWVWLGAGLFAALAAGLWFQSTKKSRVAL